MPKNQPFLTDVQELRAKARASIKQGAVTPAYEGDVKQAIEILQAVLVSGPSHIVTY
jgi:bacterioferritin